MLFRFQQNLRRNARWNQTMEDTPTLEEGEKCGLVINFGSAMATNCTHHWIVTRSKLWLGYGYLLDHIVWKENFCYILFLEYCIINPCISYHRCTIPGCQYYQTPLDMVTRATHGCTIQQDLHSVQCTINCTKGFTPLGGQDTTTCTRSSQSWDIR